MENRWQQCGMLLVSKSVTWKPGHWTKFLTVYAVFMTTKKSAPSKQIVELDMSFEEWHWTTVNPENQQWMCWTVLVKWQRNLRWNANHLNPKNTGSRSSFQGQPGLPKAQQKMASDFHAHTTKALFYCEHDGLDIQKLMAFVNACVKGPSQDDWKNSLHKLVH